jgi:tetratricopeptide (TPR) repeat protein
MVPGFHQKDALRGAGLRGCGLVLALGLLLAGCGGRRIEELTAQGQAAEAAGEKAKAAAIYSQVLLRQPENHELRRRVAGLYFDVQDHSVAASHYLALLRVEPGAEEIRRRATVSLLALERYPEAGELVKAELSQRPDSWWGREAQGDLLLRQGEFAGALTNYTTALGAYALGGEDRYRVTLKHARALFSSRQPEKALEELNALVKDAPDRYDAHLLRANYYLATGDTNAAHRAYVELQGRFPQADEPVTGLAVLAVAEGRVDAAIGLYEKANQLDPARADNLFWLAELHFRKNDRAALEALLRRIEPKTPGHEAAMNYVEGLLRLQREEIKEAVEYLERARPFVFGYGGLLDKLGRAYLQLGDTEKAERYLYQVQYSAEEAQALWGDLAQAHLAARNFPRAVSYAEAVADARRPAMLAEAHFGLGDYANAMQAARQWMEKEPGSVAARLIAVESSLRLNRDDPGALNFLRELAAQSPDTPLGVYARAQVLLVEARYAEAADLLIQHYETMKEQAGANRALGEALALAGRGKEAVPYLQQALKLDPSLAQAEALLGMIDLQGGDAKSARERFQHVLKRQPFQRAALLGRSLLDYYAGEFTSAAEGFDQLIRGGLKDTAVHNLLTVSQFQRGRRADALTAAEAGWKLSPDDRLAGYLAVSAQRWNGQTNAARATLERCFKLDAAFAPFHHAAALLAADQGRFDRALEHVREGLKHEADNPLLRPFEAELLRKLKRYDEALAAAAKLQAEFPNDETSWSTEGNTRLDQRSFPAARAAYRKALEIAPKDRALQQRLLDTYVLAGRVGEAAPDMERLLERDPANQALRFTCARLRAERGEKAQAERHYREIIKADPRAVPALNNLATLLADDPARTEDARRFAEQAFAADGDNPLVRDTLAVIYLQTRRPHDALQLLQAARLKAPDHAEILLHLTQAQWEAGRQADARQSWEELNRRFPDVVASPAAEKLRAALQAPARQ